MANSLCEVLLTDVALAPPRDDSDPGAGAIASFWGMVRALEDGSEIDGLDYEAHRAMAEHQLRRVGEEAMKNFQLRKIVIHHRVGFVRAGEASLFLEVRAGHRAAVFEASKWVVDELKKRVPIWKRPRFKVAARRLHESHLSGEASAAKL